MPTLTAGGVKRTANVITRHSANCPDKPKGLQYQNCKCWKSLAIYEHGKTRFKSAGTRSWSEAETVAKDYLKSFDPDQIELKAHRLAKERAAMRIEDAVERYQADMVARLGDGGSVANVRTVFGRIDPKTKAVVRDGHLFGWINKQVPRLNFLSELTADRLTDWRASWEFKSDLTASQRWGEVVSFFAHAKRRKWITENPCDEMRPLRATRGNRTAVFSDSQYDSILAVAKSYVPNTIPKVLKKVWLERQTAFLELLRWSGCDTIDAVNFRPEQIDADGTFRYHRQKTKHLAAMPLPEWVVILLRHVPLDSASVGPEMPFRSKGRSHTDARVWQYRMRTLFEKAGIKSVRTEIGQVKEPHCKMLRDTFAVWHLRKGVGVFAVSKYLGHSNVNITAKHYLPWIKELEDATIAEGRKALETFAQPKAPRGVAVLVANRKTR